MEDDDVTLLQTLGDLDPESLILDQGGTLVAPRRPLADCPSFVTGDGATLEWSGKVIGLGGMGVVREARQVDLDRMVAVKCLPAGVASGEAQQQLYREAWVAGRLEHPNVVPVHQLAVDETGGPAIVMKKVDGLPWSEVLERPADHPHLLAGQAPLDFSLAVLEQVCRAVHFAHCQGILHRDLKPENVMLGRFGEVYLVDWGLAVALDARAVPLPPAAAIRAVEGTPGYLAPEMAAGAGREIGVASDVFLLGAVLHRLLTGRPRWQGVGILPLLAAALRAEPPCYGPEVPAELARIATRAMAREPGQRHADAEAFRRDLAGYRVQAASRAIAARAEDRLAQLREEFAAQNEIPEVDRLAAEALFGFQSALELWADNHEARASLSRLASLMARHEVSREQVSAAESWLGLLEAPDPELAAELAELRQRLEARREELDRLRKDNNFAIGARARAVVSTMLWVAVAGGAAVLQVVELLTDWRAGYPAITAIFVVYLLGVAVPVLPILRRRIPYASRVQLGILMANAVGFLAMIGFGWIVGLPPSAAIALVLLLVAFFTLPLSVAVHPRMLAASLAYFAGCGAVLWWPRYFLGVGALVGGLGMLGMAWAWQTLDRQGRPSRPRERSASEPQSR